MLKDILLQPWPWFVAGPIIALVMFGLLLSGKELGISGNLRTMCSIAGAGKHASFFDFDWKSQVWNLVFLAGLIIGGFIANKWMISGSMDLSVQTLEELKILGIDEPGSSLAPINIFSWNNLLTVNGLIYIVLGGFLVGFGSRYAGGCTSGHAISGLSNLQLPSLIAVIGFFIGGLLVTYLVTPYLLG